ncbi:MAG: gamma-glutamylcyclotransferase family protein [Pseudomonadota bacterium]
MSHHRFTRPWRVGVYGTLKKGFSNHRLLSGTPFLGTDRMTNLTLYDLGPYPAALERPSGGIEVEIYAVNAQELAALDRLEDYHPEAPEKSLYLRKPMATRFGEAWFYLYNQPISGARAITRGGWPARL